MTTLAEDGVDGLVGLVLAPHFSRASVGQYQDRLMAAASSRTLPVRTIDSWHLEPTYLAFLERAVRDALTSLPHRTHVLFTAHSLPERALVEDPYPDQLMESAAAVAEAVGLDERAGWSIAWQSAGRTADPWRGPDVLAVIRELAATGRADGVVVCPQGFVSDHLEVVYDLDIEAAGVAHEVGLAFARTRVLNDDPAVLGALADRILATAPMTSFVVVGGGITGLVAAREAAIAGAEVTIVEPGRLGGKVQTSPFDGGVLDEAADAFLARVPEGVGLCRELGIDGDLVSPAARRAHVWSRGALRLLPEAQVLGVPTDLDELAGSGILSAEGSPAWSRHHRCRAPTGRRHHRRPDPRTQLGDEAAERLVDPLVGGINAGDTDQLSLAATVPQLDAAARSGAPTLVDACRAQRASVVDPTAPVFFAPRAGMGALVDALVADLERRGVTVAPGSAVRIESSGASWHVTADLGTTSGEAQGSARSLRAADGVVVTTPAPSPPRSCATPHLVRQRCSPRSPTHRWRSSASPCRATPSTGSSTAAGSSSRASRAAPSPPARGPPRSGRTCRATGRCGCGRRSGVTAPTPRSRSTTRR